MNDVALLCSRKLTPTLGSSGYRHNPVTWMDLPVLSRGIPFLVARAPSPFFLYSPVHPEAALEPPLLRRNIHRP